NLSSIWVRPRDSIPTAFGRTSLPLSRTSQIRVRSGGSAPVALRPVFAADRRSSCPSRAEGARAARCVRFPSWPPRCRFRSVGRVILVIRFIGVMNAAIWLGAAVSFTFAAAPAFFSGEALKMGLHPYWRGAMAELVLARYFYLQYICGA